MTDDLPGAQAAPVLDAVREALAAVRQSYGRRYGETVFEVDVRTDGGGRLRLTGQVLLPAQARAAVEAAAGAAGQAPVNAIRVLAADEEGQGWAMPRREVLDVLDAPEGQRATQVVRRLDPPLRRLLRRRDWWLVALADGTLGWVPAGHLEDLSPVQAPPDVASWRRRFAGHPRRVPRERWRQEAGQWLGVPYLLGGTTPAGVDCSGLCQRLYRAVLGIGLPRHSRDQARCGRRVPAAGLEAGDLLLLTHRQSRFWHVALSLDGDGPPVVHACREKGQVVEEPLPALFERYSFRGARRFDAGR